MAKRFAFRLEPVLRYRSQLENEKQREFAAVQTEYNAKEDQVRNLNQLFVQVQQRFGQAKTAGNDVKLWMSYQSYLNDIKNSIFNCLSEQQKIRKRLEQKRAELVQAARRRRVLEKLREKRFADHVRENNRMEQKELDEIALRNYYG